jgi:hypothetical protein
LNEKYNGLRELLGQIDQNKRVKNNREVEETLVRHLTSVSEDIHWLLLIAGFTLFEVNAEIGEARIPNEIMNYSIMCSSFVDFQLVNTLLLPLNRLSLNHHHNHNHTHLDVDAKTISFDLMNIRLVDENQPCDPITRLFLNAFQLAELEMYAAAAHNSAAASLLDYLSPQVGATLVWFLKEATRSYLFMTERNYQDLSPTLHLVFAPDTQIGKDVLKFFVRKVLVNFHIWSAENTITIQSAKLLFGNLD